MTQESFYKLLKSNNLNDTVERRVIFDAVNSFTGEFIVTDLTEKLDNEYISKASVNNTLRLFLNLGIIKRVPSLKLHYVYEAVRDETGND